MQLNFTKDIPNSGMIVVPVAKDAAISLPAGLSAAEAEAKRAAKASDFSGKPGQTVVIAGPEAMPEATLMLLGAGEIDADKALAMQKLGGKIAAQAVRRAKELTILAPGGAAADVAYGAMLRSYSFTKYMKKAEADELPKLQKINVVSDDPNAEDSYNALGAVADGVKLARDLVTEPPNVLHPESYAELCKEELEGLGVEIEILGEKELAKHGMHMMLGVGQGSVRESKMVVMKWSGGGSEKPIAFIGKGVTFDTGGISLKPGANMDEMKMDMGGSAAVVGAIRALAGRKAKVNAVGLIGLVENMPDGNAQRPGDIVDTMSGQTVEILNTDAEGRLVLGDVLTYCQKFHQPKAMVDLATLTGAIIIALAHEYGGLFTEDDSLATALLEAGDTSGDELWRMPLGDAHRDMIKSDVADMKNIGGRDGGSSSAAAFLSRFVEKGTPWAHLDIAGSAWVKKDSDTSPKGATGFGVRLLNEWAKGFEA
ncbi:leucyl aminopeptidase [Parvularcula sp. ZS-1/3]|uniref:Probable cytosol aminopeptidase n=1 Tax=Parvularcula mediterranea TaxID=2732508 RepID=A0A7Y3W558_9PROT|nr:leucyl aminopeptidase [Parvularcula mediterranea]NNU16284.1 leucyl aminopeptidase [Parvularcula mediterranea]